MIRGLFLVVIIALLGALSVGFLGSIHPAFDTAANFRAQSVRSINTLFPLFHQKSEQEYA